MSVAVLCATRGRPREFSMMKESVRATSKAEVYAYIDADDRSDYDRADTVAVSGPRVGPVAALNRLLAAAPHHEAYVAATDDCRFVTPGWDRWVLQQTREHPVSALQPFVNGIAALSFPCVTRRWVEALGWIGYPRAYHFCWDTIIELLAEPIGLIRAQRGDFEIVHPNHTSSNLMEHFEKDARSFLFWCVRERHDLLAKLRAA